jgi:hypothetical protein
MSDDEALNFGDILQELVNDNDAENNDILVNPNPQKYLTIFLIIIINRD